MDPRRETGERGEDLAANYLTRRGWEVLERNWRTAAGELPHMHVVDVVHADVGA